MRNNQPHHVQPDDLNDFEHAHAVSIYQKNGFGLLRNAVRKGRIYASKIMLTLREHKYIQPLRH
jgi:hypothetical protein